MYVTYMHNAYMYRMYNICTFIRIVVSKGSLLNIDSIVISKIGSNINIVIIYQIVHLSILSFFRVGTESALLSYDEPNFVSSCPKRSLIPQN